MSGRLEVITGPMFSGKTEELIRRVHRAQYAGKTVVAFKHSVDQRYKINNIVSHNGMSFKCMNVDDSTYIKRIGSEHDVVAIDEAQFFDETLRFPVSVLLALDKTVIMTGLDTTFRGEPWPHFPYFLAIADKLDKLSAVCVVCGNDAAMTQRLTNGKPASLREETTLVGGTDKYEARCRDCWRVSG